MDGRGDTGEDWGPFGRPLFDDPSARKLSRVGVVDVGSNSVRLVVFDGAARSPAYFFNEKILCGLGRGIAETGHLHPEGRARALSAIKRFQRLADGMNLGPLSAVATAAVRDAEDGPEFRAQVLRETGLELYVINGEEEARLSAQGVLLGWPDAQGLMCDIGGSSLELAHIQAGEVGKRVTSPLGPLKLAGVPGGKRGLKAEIARVVDDLAEEMGTDHKRLFLVGGSWRAIARLDMERRGYPLTVLHEYRMTPKSLSKTLKWIDEVDLDEVRQRTGTSSARMALVPIAAQVLKRLMHVFRPKEIAISSYGIREGLLYEQMPDRLRKRDPLIEACYHAEKKDARKPGFGKALFRFLTPLYKSLKPEDLRVIRAACLLHDVSWRAHPDYRHEVCFDNATRANLGGLTHEQRVFLGLALLHRYKNSREGSHFAPLFDILSDKMLARAEVLGKAMRFGAMFSVEDPTRLAELRWFPKKRELVLILRKEADGLFGEVAEARFQTLAEALNATPIVKKKR
ncbi:Ppx/GppA family phosphatase [Aliiroseovarius sp. S1123]|jgi:exopolyphosphatase/guanosine-5'-triphosphate,3'-diphosphate pyrophosphatase|uniref:Ppx/GppA family phosphatase n=1 Tax=unclassified Aliiroseovarius TaxID=2623558 RepID=UPI001FF68890|nr:Ppx/GppA family phosphatase [Aliiroseovarius sp. S1123]MCK0169768.1 Ppx/GppA family phosphatase [Aliiroseovarius sp. S1123]